MPAPRSCPDGSAPSSIERMFDTGSLSAPAPTVPAAGSRSGEQQRGRSGEQGRSREQIVADLRRRIGATALGQEAASLGSGAIPSGQLGRLDPAATTATRLGAGAGRHGTVMTAGRERARLPGAEQDVLPVLGPLADALPHGGLPRGGVVSVVGTGPGRGVGGGHGTNTPGADEHRIDTGRGSSSLLLSLLAAPTPRWSALVGMPDIGLAAASELGVDLDHLVVIPDPGPDVLHVLSVLADGVDLIAVGAPRGRWGTPARQRILTARLRQHGTVLVVVGRWPGADLVLSARHTGWAGLGRGHGRLRDRELTIDIGGRRAGGPRRERTVLLSGRRNGDVVLSGVVGAPVPAKSDTATTA